jgi:hypothetical protein
MMELELKPGAQLASVVCAGRVVLVKVPADRVPVIGCGGRPMVPVADAAAGAGNESIDPARRAGLLLGKRYEADGVEVLCTAAGEGTLTCDGEPMALKTAKPLPASD